MPLSSADLEVIMDGIQERIAIANRNNTLQDILNKLGWGDLLPTSTDCFESYADGKIVVLGASEVKERHLLGVAKSLGINPNRLEFCLDYYSLIHYPYKKLQYNPHYRVVLVGPAPHKSEATGYYSSMVSAMEQQLDYPKIVRLIAGNALKITKNNFEQALREMLQSGFLTA